MDVGERPYAVAALADKSRGDHSAGEPFGEAVMTAAACRIDLDVRAVLDDVLAKFGQRLAHEIAPHLEAVAPELAVHADEELAATNGRGLGGGGRGVSPLKSLRVVPTHKPTGVRR
jgi:hypothetical protein